MTPVCSLEEALQSELTQQENIVQEADCDLGRLHYLGGPVKFSAAQSAITRRAPRLGEHTQEVLRELGYSEEQLAELRAAKAVL